MIFGDINGVVYMLVYVGEASTGMCLGSVPVDVGWRSISAVRKEADFHKKDMARITIKNPEMRTIILVDAVNFTSELKAHGREAITPKINRLQEFAEFFFVYKLKGKFIGKLGDGFLILCPPTPPEIIGEALSCQGFIDAFNVGKAEPFALNARIAIHYGLIAPPEHGNFIDTNLNLTARLEGATPPNCICISSTLYDIVADTLRDWKFEELQSTFKGLGENRYYVVSNPSGRTSEPSRRESRLSFYFSTLSALRDAEDWAAVKNTCEQALLDFPGNPEFTNQLGIAHLILDDCPAAIRAFEQCVSKDYEVGDSLLFMGRAYDQMGNQARAIEVLTQAAEKEPKPFHALGDIADIYLDLGNYDEAIRWAKRSLKANLRFITPMATLIAIYLIQRDDDACIRVVAKLGADRHEYLRECVENRMEFLGAKGFKTRLGAIFRATKKG